MLKYLCLVWTLAFSPFSLSKAFGAQDPATEATQAYQQGDFTRATGLYLQLIERNPNNASLYHNLGTALYRQGDLGAAVAAYLRAARLQPRDPDIRYNLQFLLGKGSDRLDDQLPQKGWRQLLIADESSERELFYGTLLFFCLSTLSGAWLVQRRPAWLALMVPGLCISFYLGLNLIYKRQVSPLWGAVHDAEIAAYSSPTEKNAVVIFQLHAGAPVAIMEEQGDWLKIGLSDLKTGWIPRRGLIVFGRDGRGYEAIASARAPAPT